MKLHYSQTRFHHHNLQCKFYYLMKLHYSQTAFGIVTTLCMFYYLMKLHYSQTKRLQRCLDMLVLLPYEITLFSNTGHTIILKKCVLLPYEITLFSNQERYHRRLF